MLKKIIAIIFAVSILMLSSCSSSHSEFYGAWYYDDNGERNAIQFSVNDNGEEVFIWATYDIENDEILSIAKGYFKISGDTITLDYVSSDIDLALNYTLVDDKLTLSTDAASMTLTRYVLE